MSDLPVGHPDHAPIPKEYVRRERYEELEAEVERLDYLHKTDHSLADQWLERAEKAEAENASLRHGRADSDRLATMFQEQRDKAEAEVERLKADVQAAKDGQRCCHGCPDCVGIGVRHELDWRQGRLDKAEHLLGRWMRGDVIPEVTATFLREQENTEKGED